MCAFFSLPADDGGSGKSPFQRSALSLHSAYMGFSSILSLHLSTALDFITDIF